jgi:hypothetical protein
MPAKQAEHMRMRLDESVAMATALVAALEEQEAVQ